MWATLNQADADDRHLTVDDGSRPHLRKHRRNHDETSRSLRTGYHSDDDVDKLKEWRRQTRASNHRQIPSPTRRIGDQLASSPYIQPLPELKTPEEERRSNQARQREDRRRKSERVGPSPPRIRYSLPASTEKIPLEIPTTPTFTHPGNSAGDTRSTPVDERPASPPPLPRTHYSLPVAAKIYPSGIPITPTLGQRSISSGKARFTPVNEHQPHSQAHDGHQSPATSNQLPASVLFKGQHAQSHGPSFTMPNVFRYAVDTVPPDDSWSGEGQIGSTPPSWSSHRASIALSGSTSVPKRWSSFSGVLGIKTYHYDPLNESEFRLIRILQKTTSNIKCEIEHHSLENPPDYIAISYAWGDADDSEKIVLEGATIPVTVSLYGALWALREKKKSVLVWVDALSIDQKNRDERTQQVQYMTSIYSKATSVAIWLGPEGSDGKLGTTLLEEIAKNADSEHHIRSLLSSRSMGPEIPALVSLFERDYWKRLWVVQEVFNAKDVIVHYGPSKLPWDVYKSASNAFQRHKRDLDDLFPRNIVQERDQRASKSQYSFSQVLVYLGPSSFPDVSSLVNLRGEEILLEVMRACRDKLTADPRDKLYGILGILPESIRKEFPVDYNLSTKEVYISVADYILNTTERLDVICESIHFPIHTSSANLPTWIPNWDYITTVTAMGRSFNFSAAGTSSAEFETLDRQRKLKISAIFLDTVSEHGIGVGTLCTLADYLMAFLHWRALLLGRIDSESPKSEGLLQELQEVFCRTLCLNQVPLSWSEPQKWVTACFHVFASLIQDRLPRLPLDRELRSFLHTSEGIMPEERRKFLQQHFGSRMFGRCFCLTADRLIGMGSGFMAADDIIVVPLGCSTPVILRRDGQGEYRFVGDVYIHGYMEGRAWDELKANQRELREYILH